MTSFASRVIDATAEPCLPAHHALIDIDLDGEAWRLSAGFADLRPSGLVRWRCDERRATNVLEAWLHHLALCADTPAGVCSRAHAGSPNSMSCALRHRPIRVACCDR